MQLPVLTSNVFSTITKFIEEPIRKTLGFNTLLELILNRKSSRDTSLQILLNYCTRPDEKLRDEAIQLVKAKLYGDQRFTKSIYVFALESLSKLATSNLKSDETDGQEQDVKNIAEPTWNKTSVKQQIQLFLSICEKTPALFHK